MEEITNKEIQDILQGVEILRFIKSVILTGHTHREMKSNERRPNKVNASMAGKIKKRKTTEKMER
jgi:hypothetical protein